MARTETRAEIKFLDLVSQHRELEPELLEVFRKTLRTACFNGGKELEEFERDFSAFCETKYCVGVGSGTDAIRLSLIAAGVSRGEGVLTVPNTFIATVEAISHCGAKPEFIDVDSATYNMDPEKLREFLETRCRRDGKSGRPVTLEGGSVVAAVLPVHLYGQVADLDSIRDLAEEYGLVVLEDACQAHGALYSSRRGLRWQKAGSAGLAGAFSFYPGKNLGACGEAGAVTTDDGELADRLRMLRNHGQREKHTHELIGENARLDSIQAGLLRVKLRHLGTWTEKRRERAQRYNELLSNVEEITIPFEPPWSKSVFHLYVIRATNRSGLVQHLTGKGIQTGYHYPVPVHLQAAYKHLGYTKGDLPVAEKAATEILSLPMYPDLSEEDIERVALEIKQCYAGQ